jgi:hypothetical protein
VIAHNLLLTPGTWPKAQIPKLRKVQLSERMLGGVIVPAAVKAMPPVATVTASGNRKEGVLVYTHRTQFQCAKDWVGVIDSRLACTQMGNAPKKSLR